MPKVDVEPVV